MRLSGLIPAFFFAHSLLAQATQIQILADRTRLTAGEALTLRAVLADDKGKVLPGQDVSWSVAAQTSTVARVSEQGLLTALLPGVALVRAQSGNTWHELAFQVLPKRIAITPGNPTMLVGETRTFTATAFDVNDRPIPGVNFTWSVLSTINEGDLMDTGALTIDSRGQGRARQEGKSYLRAQFNHTPPPGYGLTIGMTPFSYGQTLVTVNVPNDYSAKVLYSNAQSTGTTELGSRPSPVWATPDASFYFKASLGGGTTGLVRYREGELKTLLTAGGPATQVGSRVLDVASVAVNANGDYLVLEQTTDGNRLRRYLADGTANTLLVANVPAAGVERLSGFAIYRNSLNRSGQFLFVANYFDPVARQSYQGLFLGAGVGVDRLLFSTKERVPEITGEYRIAFCGLSEDGTAYMRLDYAGTQALYRVQDSGPPRRILGGGDAFAGSTMRAILTSPDGERQEMLVARNGDVLFGLITAKNEAWIVRYDAASQSFESFNRGAAWAGNSVLDYHPDYGALLYSSSSPVWLWKDGKRQDLITTTSEPFAGHRLATVWGSACGGAFGPNGETNIYCRTAEFPNVAGQIAPERKLYFRSGDAVATGPRLLNSFVKATRGPVQMFSGYGAVAEWDGATVKDYRVQGTPFDAGTVYWGTIGSPLNYHRLEDGSVIQYAYWFRGGTNHGVIQYRADGTAKVLISYNPIMLDGFTYYSGGVWANGENDILVSGRTDFNHNRLAILRDGPLRTILTSGGNPQQLSYVDGLTVNTYGECALGSRGEVLTLVTYRERGNNNAAALWDGTKWRTILQSGVDRLRYASTTRLITSIDALRRTGPDFWMRVNTDAGNGIVRCNADGLCELMALGTDVMPSGLSPGFIHAHEANLRGDLLIQASGNVFAKRNGAWKTVLNISKALDGHWLMSVLDIQLRDDGTVYLLLVNSRSETLLVEAKPKE